MTRNYGNELGKQQQVMRMDFEGFWLSSDSD